VGLGGRLATLKDWPVVKMRTKGPAAHREGYQYESSTIMPLMARLLNTGIQIQ
jgi:hypothetical protein